jgi:ketosteroid isomerase-like protein
MEFRHGLIANYREYWNPTAITAAMTGTGFDKSAG